MTAKEFDELLIDLWLWSKLVALKQRCEQNG